MPSTLPRRQVLALTGLGIGLCSGCVGTIVDEDSTCDRELIDPPEEVEPITHSTREFTPPEEDPQERVRIGNRENVDPWIIYIGNFVGVEEFCVGIVDRSNSATGDDEVVFNRRYVIPEGTVVRFQITRTGLHYLGLHIPDTETNHGVQQRIRATDAHQWGGITTRIVIFQTDEILSRTAVVRDE